MPTTEALVLAVAEGEEVNPLIPAWYDIIWSAVVFALILVFFARYVMPKMRELEAKRIEGIEAKLAQAERDRVEAQALLAQYREQLAEARGEASRIRAEAQSERKSIVDEARSEAQAAAQQVTERQQAQMHAELAQARAQLSREVGTLAVALSERILGESLADPAQARSSVDRFLSEMETTSAGSTDGRGATAVGDRPSGSA